MFLAQIKQFFVKNKKIFFYFAFFIFIYYLFSETGFAESVSKPMSEDEQKLFNTLSTLLNTGIKGITLITGAMTYFITLFLEPGWINGSIFKLNDAFKTIWIMISNVVYFIFAGILIWIAFMNIIGHGDKWELKKMLPKFIVGVLIVPFSWFFIQLVLSISGYLTMSFLTLPNDIFPDYNTKLSTIKVPTKCTININYDTLKDTTKDTTSSTDDNKNKLFYCDETTTTLDGALEKSSFGLISMYTYGILNVENINKIYQSQVEGGQITTLLSLIVKIVFDFLFIIVYMILFITLGLVLATRGLYIWIFTMFSPAFGLMYFFEKKDGGDGFIKKFSVKEFISLAFVPVYVMLALSFGLFFISTITTSITNMNSNVTGNVAIDGSGNKIKIGNTFELEFIAPVGSSDGKSNTDMLFAIGKDAKEGVLGTIGSLLLYLLGIVVLRVTIMAALRSSDITKEVTQPIYDFGAQVGSIIQKAPQNLPIFGGQSMNSLKNLSGAAESSMMTSANKKSEALMEKYGLFGADKSGAKLRALQSEIFNANDKVSQEKAAHNIFNAVDGDATKLYRNDVAKERIFELMEKMKVKIDTIKSPDDIKSEEQITTIFKAMQKKYPNAIFGKQINSFNDIKDQVKKDKTSDTSSETGGSTESKKDNTPKINLTINNYKDNSQNISKILQDTVKQKGGYGTFTFDEFKGILEGKNFSFDDKELEAIKKKIEDESLDDKGKKIPKVFKD